jgi:F-type H+-transporting ATPase subunit a
MDVYLIFSPLDQFEVTNLIGISAQIVGLFNICLTNFSFYILLVLLIVVGLHFYADNDYKLVLNK